MNGKELKQKREALGMTQMELARVLGVDVSTVSRWERGIRSIPAHLPLALETLGKKSKKINKK
jgi:transcriptional regulator with XRE-family HTH domain